MYHIFDQEGTRATSTPCLCTISLALAAAFWPHRRYSPCTRSTRACGHGAEGPDTTEPNGVCFGGAAGAGKSPT